MGHIFDVWQLFKMWLSGTIEHYCCLFVNMYHPFILFWIALPIFHPLVHIDQKQYYGNWRNCIEPVKILLVWFGEVSKFVDFYNMLDKIERSTILYTNISSFNTSRFKFLPLFVYILLLILISTLHIAFLMESFDINSTDRCMFTRPVLFLYIWYFY